MIHMNRVVSGLLREILAEACRPSAAADDDDDDFKSETESST
jgi:hypothetical protein